jgi:hypothetical protein
MSAEELNWHPGSIKRFGLSNALDGEGFKVFVQQAREGLFVLILRRPSRMKKRIFLIILFGTLGLWYLGFGDCLSAQEKPLRIYGPEGPFAPMKECAEMFARIYGVKTEVLTGPGIQWMAKAKEVADVIYEETEHSLTHFMTRHP